MTVRMDKFGRILIPKAVREARGFKPGDEFEIGQEAAPGEGLRLKPIERLSSVRVDQDGPLPVWKYVGEDGREVVPDVDWLEVIRGVREERSDRGAGL